MDSLAGAVRRRRKEVGLTQRDLALLSGVGVGFVGFVESGKPGVRLDHIFRVLRALGLGFRLIESHTPFVVEL